MRSHAFGRTKTHLGLGNQLAFLDWAHVKLRPTETTGRRYDREERTCHRTATAKRFLDPGGRAGALAPSIAIRHRAALSPLPQIWTALAAYCDSREFRF